MEAELMSAMTQFGVAGLVCWMWLSERRASAEREKQITESHEQITAQREERIVLIQVVQENTKALSAIEHGQRELGHIIKQASECGRASNRSSHS